MKNRTKYHFERTVPKSNRKMVYKREHLIPLTHILDRSLSLLDKTWLSNIVAWSVTDKGY
jgi:hypothetical protein